MGGNGKKIGIITCCCDDWGGSEELWARSIPALLEDDCAVTVYKGRINRDHPRFMELQSWGVELNDLDIPQRLSFGQRLLRRLRVGNNGPADATGKRKLPGEGGALPPDNPWEKRFAQYLQAERPDLVVVAQGINFDGLGYAQICLARAIPYVVIIQKAAEFYWPAARDRAGMIRAFLRARKCIFVSNQNRQLTEEQFGIRLTNTQIIYNPVRVSGMLAPFPAVGNGYQLACIGRLFILDKGQDILLRILDRPRWRERPIRVSFIGTGIDEEGLRSMAGLLDLHNVSFTGQVEDIGGLWDQFHALVLPSRSEGLPLVVLEAMAAGRMVIASRAGGSQEIVQEGVTGFIGDANADSFEQTLEKAWERRDEWEAMGQAAHDHIRLAVPPSPELAFASCLIALLGEEHNIV